MKPAIFLIRLCDIGNYVHFFLDMSWGSEPGYLGYIHDISIDMVCDVIEFVPLKGATPQPQLMPLGHNTLGI